MQSLQVLQQKLFSLGSQHANQKANYVFNLVVNKVMLTMKRFFILYSLQTFSPHHQSS